MVKRQPPRVQCLTLEVDRPRLDACRRVAPLTHERVSADRGLDSDLISSTGPQSNFDEACTLQFLEDAIIADGVLRIGIFPNDRLLDQGLCIPDQPIFPGAMRRMDVPVHDGSIDALGLTLTKPLSQRSLRAGILGEHNETRRI